LLRKHQPSDSLIGVVLTEEEIEVLYWLQMLDATVMNPWKYGVETHKNVKYIPVTHMHIWVISCEVKKWMLHHYHGI
jgi:hypothetical protein